ncbi:MAG: XRE family transcriptional regulator [Chloroflexi bacterium]|nr:MAG: XRE family transcriptional regulator [Chloroflexota bacterium]MBL1194356.1 XRE family transcriptional regulator [Chloroflexota bacterium]NOH11645.1 helix-turn-helix transcriptional regulator [Chloroflexota bacterium]
MLKPDKWQIILNEVFGPQTELPNKFTIGMGKFIRESREELGWSQTELAARVDMRRATLSNIENGKSEPSATQIFYLSVELNKPITSFFPKFARDHLPKEELDLLTLELIQNFLNVNDESLQRVAINQVKALSEWDTKPKRRS